MNQSGIAELIRQKINERGLKLTAVASKTQIKYQRLQRIFNQDAAMSATELVILCLFLNLDLSDFTTNGQPQKSA